MVMVELVPLREVEGRISVEGALPYPPGELSVVPGEIWGGSVQRYFFALEEGINLVPVFALELQGVYLEPTGEGRVQAMGYVLTRLSGHRGRGLCPDDNTKRPIEGEYHE
uniref:Z59f protein n=1 Tax=Vibrio cholerae TaxID=666 RepID=O87063_VIBCL|nr:z59f [Vibrio cholerae]